MKVCIDPGHGGYDPGAVGNGLREKDIVLHIALEAARILRTAGQIVSLTRETDRYIGLNAERTPAADISVSIHVNSGGGQGLETWVSLFNRPIESKALGQAIQAGILKQIPFHNRGLKTGKNTAGTADYLYMLRKPAGVAVLVECGFIDSGADAAILRSPENLKKIARGIAGGVAQYLDVKGEDEDMLVKLNLKTDVDLPEAGIRVNGKDISPGVILNVSGKDTTYAPARAIAEALGATVGWDDKTKTVLIERR
jgi:N-acetylmuramoyl-L-alanine amidase